MVFKMAEVGFLRGVIPTVTSSGHRLTKLVLLEQFLKGRACMAALVLSTHSPDTFFQSVQSMGSREPLFF